MHNINSGSGERKATSALAAKEPLFIRGPIYIKGNRVQHAEPTWIVLQVVQWGHNSVIIVALVDVGPTLLRFQDSISQDSFTILCTSKDNNPFMGGSDIVHCITFTCNEAV